MFVELKGCDRLESLVIYVRYPSRLDNFCDRVKQGHRAKLRAATPEYFRSELARWTAIACVYRSVWESSKYLEVKVYFCKRISR